MGLRPIAQSFRTLGCAGRLSELNPVGVAEGEDEGAISHRLK